VGAGEWGICFGVKRVLVIDFSLVGKSGGVGCLRDSASGLRLLL